MSASVPRVECPWCERGPLPAKKGTQLCSNCSMIFTVPGDTTEATNE